ncbi:MAG: VCBS repeat-containing protein, partial [Thermoplasmata archaeon]|nr:VCBS repeat-containing protein [Thermoplasmata archaeon]
MTSSTVTEDVLAASGVITTFSNGDAEGIITYTKDGDNAKYAIKLPKESNILEASMVFKGTDYLKENVNRTIRSSFDWRQGTQIPDSTLMSDTSGFHLDMDRLAPFEAETTINAGSMVYSAASGDFNKDGRMDLVVTNYASDNATVFLQSAAGKLVKDRDVTTGSTPKTVEVGDLNGDGLDDFAVGNYRGESVNVFLSKSTGGFTKSTISLAPGRRVLDLDIADLNDDNLDDFVLATESSYGDIWFQSSAGGFYRHKEIDVTTGGYSSGWTYYARGCAAGDFNNDGRIDVAFTASTSYTSTWSYEFYGMLKV